MSRRKSPAAIAAASEPSIAVRDRLFELAGFDVIEQAALTRSVINKLCSLMSAQRVTRLVVNAGLNQSEVREFIDEDGALQARAAKDLTAILGIEPSKSVGNNANGSKVQVQVAFVQRPGSERAPKLVGKARILEG